MKKWAMILVAAFAATTFAACGGDNHGHNDGDDHGDHGDGEGGHGHGHGDAEELGTQEKDGYEIDVDLAVDKKNPLSGAVMVSVKKDGKVVKGATVTIAIVDKAGEIVGEVSEAGEWEKDENLYDCHAVLPKDHDGKFVKVTVRDGDTTVEFDPIEL
ncbi:MAG: hypothetical protein L3J82_06075 [Planctomycetes bacterium]|nr:hypothetical protein [Planctomycetota bacterium]